MLSITYWTKTDSVKYRRLLAGLEMTKERLDVRWILFLKNSDAQTRRLKTIREAGMLPVEKFFFFILFTWVQNIHDNWRSNFL